MGIFKVYLKPFDDDGVYQEFFDVTKYVNLSSISDVLEDIDSSDYQFGVFRFSNIRMKVSNKQGYFSDVENLRSFFRYKRGDSQIKITYQLQDGPYCGIAIAGVDYLSDETVIFKGLISDEALEENAKSQDVTLTVLGFESIFKRVKVPYASLSIGMTPKNAMYAILNQTGITDLLTVNLGNINPELNQTLDAVTSFQNQTVKEALDALLVATNSVLYIRDDAIHVTDRDASDELMATFYGQASQDGAENVVDISNIKNGLSRVFNFITWSSTNLSDEDAESVTKYGIKKKELGWEFYTNDTKRNTILDSLVSEFGLPKQELELEVPLSYDTLAVRLLDRVAIDYPTILVGSEGDLPICGIAQYGIDQLPDALWNLTISTDEPYKVLSKKISVKNQRVRYHLRRI